MDLNRLKEPFREEEVEFRLAQCGETGNKVWAYCLAYISARAIMNRLDDVCGHGNWKATYDFIPAGPMSGGVICNLSIKVGDEWVTKQDGAEFTDTEPFKGGISSALKRAGCAWGMGRYLYSLEAGSATIVEKGTRGAHYGKTKQGTIFYWLPPELPDWALPVDERLAREKKRAVNPPPVIKPMNSTPWIVSTDELGKLNATIKTKGMNREVFFALMKEKFQKTEVKQLSQDQFNQLLTLVQNYQPTLAAPSLPKASDPEYASQQIAEIKKRIMK